MSARSRVGAVVLMTSGCMGIKDETDARVLTIGRYMGTGSRQVQ